MKGMMQLLRKKKDKTNLIIKAISYCIAGIIVIGSTKEIFGIEDNNIIYKMGKYGSIIAIILVVIATIFGIYKLVRYLINRKNNQEDK